MNIRSVLALISVIIFYISVPNYGFAQTCVKTLTQTESLSNNISNKTERLERHRNELERAFLEELNAGVEFEELKISNPIQERERFKKMAYLQSMYESFGVNAETASIFLNQLSLSQIKAMYEVGLMDGFSDILQILEKKIRKAKNAKFYHLQNYLENNFKKIMEPPAEDLKTDDVVNEESVGFPEKNLSFSQSIKMTKVSYLISIVSTKRFLNDIKAHQSVVHNKELFISPESSLFKGDRLFGGRGVFGGPYYQGESIYMEFRPEILDDFEFHATNSWGTGGEKQDDSINSTETDQVIQFLVEAGQNPKQREIVFSKDQKISISYLKAIWVHPFFRSLILEELSQANIPAPNGKSWEDIIHGYWYYP